MFKKDAVGETYFPLDDFYDFFELLRYDLQVDEKTGTPLIFKLYKKKKRQPIEREEE